MFPTLRLGQTPPAGASACLTAVPNEMRFWINEVRVNLIYNLTVCCLNKRSIYPSLQGMSTFFIKIGKVISREPMSQEGLLGRESRRKLARKDQGERSS